MYELVEDFPLEWQEKILKALTARTLLAVGTRLQVRCQCCTIRLRRSRWASGDWKKCKAQSTW
jgi:hypothetical protein